MRVDFIEAVVDREVITHSALLTEARVALALREGEGAASAALTPELLAGLRDHIINATLIALQGRRLSAADVSEDDVAARLWQFRQHFASSIRYLAFLRRFAIAEAAVGDILRRDLQNERYIDSRIRARPRFDEQRDEAGKAEALQAWLNELRAAAEIRLEGADGELTLQARR